MRIASSLLVLHHHRWSPVYTVIDASLPQLNSLATQQKVSAHMLTRQNETMVRPNTIRQALPVQEQVDARIMPKRKERHMVKPSATCFLEVARRINKHLHQPTLASQSEVWLFKVA
ncbi:hypothetical protein PILCRDRAFT_278434 [Piloderma croceum F 1598]|uniref:Uncharacterized protein n=1 Tax=Piloderma croceum (strain F 1598) TaxID=765440 RepID=A0A0C3GA37_PILCF|nr:hypothetical protein PILCRDRAFT_278434 [Piloderma croceum F 1598]